MIGWLRKRISKRVQYDISEWLYNTRDSVKVRPTQGMFNFRCFENAVEWSRVHEGSAVIMGIYIEGERTVLHYWNVDADGGHVETTLGWRADDITYYPLRTIPPASHKAIGGVFDDAVEYFTNRFTSRFDRLVLRGERVV